MEINLDFELEKPELPKDYSPAFVSLIKHALFEYDKNLFYSIYKDRAEQEKDFCFSIRLDKPQFEPDKIKLYSGMLKLNFSILNPIEGVDFYNAFLKQKDKSYPFPDKNSITLKQVKMKNHSKIKSNSILVKMNSPLLVRKHEADIDTYLAFTDKDFNKYILLSVKHMLRSLLGLDFADNFIEFIPIKPIKTVVNTFGNRITGNVGIYRLSGDVDILNLLYQLGIGSRRSQGFGMFEIITV